MEDSSLQLASIFGELRFWVNMIIISLIISIFKQYVIRDWASFMKK